MGNLKEKFRKLLNREQTEIPIYGCGLCPFQAKVRTDPFQPIEVIKNEAINQMEEHYRKEHPGVTKPVDVKIKVLI